MYIFNVKKNALSFLTIQLSAYLKIPGSIFFMCLSLVNLITEVLRNKSFFINSIRDSLLQLNIRFQIKNDLKYERKTRKFSFSEVRRGKKPASKEYLNEIWIFLKYN